MDKHVGFTRYYWDKNRFRLMRIAYPLALLQSRMARDVTYKMLRIVSRLALVPLFLQAKACSAIVCLPKKQVQFCYFY